MKEGWKETTIGSVFDTGSGGTPLKMQDEYYKGGDIPWLRSGEVCKKYIRESKLFITQSGLENSSAKYFPVNTVVVAMYGATAGQVGILKFRTTTNQAICGILPKDGYIPEYIYYALLSKQEELVSKATGNAQPNISQIKIKNTTIPDLPLPEQQRIVDILDAEFDKIDALKANAEKNLQNAKDLFQAALKKELEPKEGWKTVRLNDIFNFIDYRGATPNKLSDGIPLITAKNVKMGFIDYSIKDFISKEEYATRQSRGISHKGDILITTEAPLGNAAIADKDIYSAGQRVITLQQYPTQNHQILNKFYLYYIISPKFQDELKRQATGLTALGIKASRLKEMKIQVLPYKEQQSIASHLDTLNKKCTTLQTNYEKTIALCDDMKQALLRKAFNGEL